MAVTSFAFQSAADQFIQGVAQWKSGGHTLKMALLSSSYTYTPASQKFFGDTGVQSNEITGTGYTAGGQALTSLTNTEYFGAASGTNGSQWATAWAASTGYNVGDIVRPATTNGYLYVCVVAGTSETPGPPSWSTVVGQTVTDNTVTWANIGESVTIYSSAAVSWTSSSIAAQFAVIYDTNPGTAATDPLLVCVDFGTTQSDSSGTFTVTPPSTGWFWTAPN